MLKRILKASAPWFVVVLLAADIISRFVKPLPINFDVVAFLLGALGIVITGLAIVGAVLVALTWNDIDKRAKEITDKYNNEIDLKIAEVNKSMEEYKAVRD